MKQPVSNDFNRSFSSGQTYSARMIYHVTRPSQVISKEPRMSKYNVTGQIGTVRYAEGLWRMRRHWPVIEHCTDSEDFPVTE